MSVRHALVPFQGVAQCVDGRVESGFAGVGCARQRDRRAGDRVGGARNSAPGRGSSQPDQPVVGGEPERLRTLTVTRTARAIAAVVAVPPLLSGGTLPEAATPAPAMRLLVPGAGSARLTLRLEAAVCSYRWDAAGGRLLVVCLVIN